MKDSPLSGPSEDLFEVYEAEVGWLFDTLEVSHGRKLRHESPMEWLEARDACGAYIRRSIELFPGVAEEDEIVLTHLLCLHGATPIDVLELFSESFRILLGSEYQDARRFGPRPHQLLTRVTLRMVGEYQRCRAA